MPCSLTLAGAPVPASLKYDLRTHTVRSLVIMSQVLGMEPVSWPPFCSSLRSLREGRTGQVEQQQQHEQSSPPCIHV